MEIQDSSTLLIVIYVLSSLLMVASIIISLKTIGTRKKVKQKHSRDMAILADWDSAIRGATSADDSEVLISLDKIWNLTNPRTYGEIRPLVGLFLNHQNREIAMRAKKILEKHEALVSLTPASDAPAEG